MVQPEQLEAVFGLNSEGNTPEQRARTSSRLFVRSEDHLAFDTPGATGRRLSAWEALQAFGIDILLEILEYGSAIIAANESEPSQSVATKRKILGWSPDQLAKAAKVALEDVKDAENPKTRTSIHILSRIAQALQLDDLRLGLLPGGGTDARYAYRVRSLTVGRQITAKTVQALNEAAWVVAKQAELASWLAASEGRKLEKPGQRGFEGDSRYGSPDYPAWRCGFDLARSTRDLLRIDRTTPVTLRSIIEEQLDIPLIQLEMDKAIAGATIAVGDVRGIVVNMNGLNRNDLIRRTTVGHELCHLLWDTEENFQSLTIDRYEDLEKYFGAPQEAKEARANAFAVELLAPQEQVGQLYQLHNDPRQGLRAVMEHFGISYTAAMWQVYNFLDRKVPLDVLGVDDHSCPDDWRGKESFVTDIFEPSTTPHSRRGKFSYCVAMCWKKGLISKQSAAAYLNCGEDNVDKGADFILEVYR